MIRKIHLLLFCLTEIQGITIMKNSYVQEIASGIFRLPCSDRGICIMQMNTCSTESYCRGASCNIGGSCFISFFMVFFVVDNLLFLNELLLALFNKNLFVDKDLGGIKVIGIVDLLAVDEILVVGNVIWDSDSGIL
mgnify:CR=1 FL=1